MEYEDYPCNGAKKRLVAVNIVPSAVADAAEKMTACAAQYYMPPLDSLSWDLLVVRSDVSDSREK
jgi:hypothetical protein